MLASWPPCRVSKIRQAVGETRHFRPFSEPHSERSHKTKRDPAVPTSAVVAIRRPCWLRRPLRSTATDSRRACRAKPHSLPPLPAGRGVSTLHRLEEIRAFAKLTKEDALFEALPLIRTVFATGISRSRDDFLGPPSRPRSVPASWVLALSWDCDLHGVALSGNPASAIGFPPFPQRPRPLPLPPLSSSSAAQRDPSQSKQKLR